MSPVEAISAALDAAGITKRKTQAALVGETDVQWTRYLNGHRSPTCAKVQRWLKTAKAAGHPVVLEWSADGSSVRVHVKRKKNWTGHDDAPICSFHARSQCPECDA